MWPGNKITLSKDKEDETDTPAMNRYTNRPTDK